MIRRAVPGLVLVSDQRRTLDEVEALVGEPQPRPAKAAAFLDEFMRKKERDWVDEPVPALGGLTPRQAVEDPSRREDLLALLREFDAMPAPLAGAATFDTGRLRHVLGL